MRKRIFLCLYLFIVTFIIFSCQEENTPKKDLNLFDELNSPAAVIGEDNPIFQQDNIEDFCIDRDGNVYILSNKHTLKKYDNQARLIWITGKSGSGPGDIGLGMKIEIFNDSLLIINDIGNKCFSIFDLHGRHLRSLRIKESAYDFGVTSSGNIVLLEKNIFYSSGKYFPKPNYEKYILSIIKINSEERIILDTLSIKRGEYKNNPLREISIPMNSKYYFVLSPDDKIMSVNSKSFTIKIFEQGGKFLNLKKVKMQNELITDKEKENYWENIRSTKYFLQAGEQYYKMIRRETEFPKYKPFFDRIFRINKYIGFFNSTNIKDKSKIGLLDGKGNHVGFTLVNPDIFLSRFKIYNNKLYSLITDDNGNYSIFVYNIANN